MLFARPPIRIFFLLLSPFYFFFVYFLVSVCVSLLAEQLYTEHVIRNQNVHSTSPRNYAMASSHVHFSLFFLLAGLFLFMNTRGFLLYIVFFFVIHQRFKVKRIDRTRRRKGEWHRYIESDITSTEWVV
jgi:hypothetical protein